MKSGTPVKVRNMRISRTDEKVLQVEFVQEITVPVTDRNTLLKMMMKGHKAFGTNDRTRVAYQNMYADAYNAYGLSIGATFPVEWGAEIVIHEFCTGDTIPAPIRNFYDGADTFTPKTWQGWEAGEPRIFTQSPKKTPEGIILSRNGAPIYRHAWFTVSTMHQDDYLVQHDNLEARKPAFAQNGTHVYTQIGNSVAR
jgi:hypothetical protein